FGIASCSKAFCCFALSQLMQDYAQGRSPTSSTLPPLPSGLKTFDWQTPMCKLMPDKWALFDPLASERATPMDCVAHATGLANHDLIYVPGETAEEIIKRLKYLKPNRGLREEWQYNNLQMYMAVQTLVADLSGVPYAQFVKQRIFDPLGMTASTFDVEAAQATQNFSQGFTFAGPGKDVKRAEPHFIPDNRSADMMAGAGGILSNVKDMVRPSLLSPHQAKWIKTLLAHGVDPSGHTPLVSEQLFKVITQGRYVAEVNGALFPEVSPMTYSGGWFRYSLQGHELVCHTGGTMGISAYTFFLPNDNMGFCLLSNTGARQLALRTIVHRLVEQLLDLPQLDWSARYLSLTAKQEQAAREKLAPRSAEATPCALELSAYCGTYKHPAYGSFTLHGPGSSPSDKGDAVISAFAAVNSSPTAPFPEEAHTTPQLYAAYDRIWCSHLRFRHKEAERWAVTGEALYPEGWGADKAPFVRVQNAWEASFGLVDGKVTGMQWMENTLYTPQMKQAGDDERVIWFERMSG
ncbi:beta-lactamase/transpeptidase-like protein, partial [Calocera cornea HHB12733]